jgi:hypothetical protein
MGLVAFVFCDCYEKGRLCTPPPGGVGLRVSPDGSLAPGREDCSLDELLAWDNWQARLACEHRRGELIHHRLGNISLIGRLRLELQREPSRFPVLLGKVVYSGSHAGDCLPIDLIQGLRSEIEELAHFKCSTPESDDFMSRFRTQMQELIAASLSVMKPIVF